MDNVIYAQGKKTITIPAGESIAVFSAGVANVYRVLGYPNYPGQSDLIGTINNSTATYGSYASGATIVIEAGAGRVFYQVGVAPTVFEIGRYRYQADPVALNATGSITAASMLGGIVTSTTAGAVAGTVPTGATMDLASEFAVGDSVDWAVINTGPNTFTVTAASGHTLVGAAAVATATSGNFRTRKTAADTFITYRLA